MLGRRLRLCSAFDGSAAWKRPLTLTLAGAIDTAKEHLGGRAGLLLRETGCWRDRVRVLFTVNLLEELRETGDLAMLVERRTVVIFSFLHDIVLNQVATGLDLLLKRGRLLRLWQRNPDAHGWARLL